MGRGARGKGEGGGSIDVLRLVGLVKHTWVPV